MEFILKTSVLLSKVCNKSKSKQIIKEYKKKCATQQ